MPWSDDRVPGWNETSLDLVRDKGDGYLHPTVNEAFISVQLCAIAVDCMEIQ